MVLQIMITPRKGGALRRPSRSRACQIRVVLITKTTSSHFVDAASVWRVERYPPGVDCPTSFLPCSSRWRRALQAKALFALCCKRTYKCASCRLRNPWMHEHQRLSPKFVLLQSTTSPTDSSIPTRNGSKRKVALRPALRLLLPQCQSAPHALSLSLYA